MSVAIGRTQDFRKAAATTRKKAQEWAGDVWIPLPKWARFGALAILGTLGIVCVVGALFHMKTNSACGLLALSDILLFGAVMLPLAMYRERRDGWFQPLIFSSLMLLGRTLWRRMGMMMSGISEHAVIPLGAEGLTRLVAFENALMGLSILSTIAGYHLYRKPWVPKLKLGQPRRIGLALGLMGGAGAVALLLSIKISGGLSQHLLNLSLNGGAKVFVEDNSAVGILTTVAQWLAIVVAIVVAYRPHYLEPFVAGWKRLNPLLQLSAALKPANYKKMLFVGVYSGAFLMAYLATGKRALLIVPGVVLCLVWLLSRRKIPYFRMVLVGGLIFVLFSGLLIFRAVSQTAKSIDDVKAVIGERMGEAAGTGLDELTYRISGYSSALAVYHYVPGSSPLLWGEGYLNLVGRPIPRAFWPSKPRGMAFRAGSQFFGAIWGIPPGSVAEAYWNFHIPGVLLLFAAFGMFQKWMATVTLRYRKQGIIIFLYAYTLVGFEPSELSITQWMQGLLPIAIFCVITGIVGPFKTAGAKP